MNILFVCSRNQWRSPTPEKVIGRWPEVSAQSAGTSPRARHTLSIEDIRWADVICPMEDKHRNRILASFSRAAHGKTMVVLDIPDEYRFMDSELVSLLEAAVEPIIDSAAARD